MGGVGARTASALAVAAVVAVAAAAPVYAAKAKALEHYRKGTTAYNLRRFQEAVDWFTKAYEEQPASEFLFNIAQSYRQLDDCEQATFFYKRYLADKPAAANRDEVEQRLVELDERCAAKKRAAAAAAAATEPGSAPKAQSSQQPPAKEQQPQPPAKEPEAKPQLQLQPQPEPQPQPPVAAETSAEVEPPRSSPVVSLIAQGGVAMLGIGDLDIPAQLSLRATAAHPIAIDSALSLEPGLTFTLTPVPFEDAAGVRSTALFITLLANVAATYALAGDLHARAEAGAGVALLGGIDRPNPFTTNLEPASGTVAMFAFRTALGVEYAVAPAIRLIVSPALAFAARHDPLEAGLMRSVELLAGIDARF